MMAARRDPPHLIAACPCGAPLDNAWGEITGIDGPRRAIVAVSCPECGRQGSVVACQVVGRPSVIRWNATAGRLM